MSHGINANVVRRWLPLFRGQQAVVLPAFVPVNVVPANPRPIDKGIPTAGLLAHVMIAKFAEHLPLYRQESIFGSAGLAISTLNLGLNHPGFSRHLVSSLRNAFQTYR
ncbi:transposase [Pseudomonas sp. TE36184]